MSLEDTGGGLLDQYYRAESQNNVETALLSSADWNEDVWTAPVQPNTSNHLHVNGNQSGETCTFSIDNYFNNEIVTFLWVTSSTLL